MNVSGSDDLFRWTDGRIVLFIERDDAGWALSRGWLSGDRLDDIRRWSFTSERRLTGQLRRLVREATGDHIAANTIVAQLELWLQTFPVIE